MITGTNKNKEKGIHFEKFTNLTFTVKSYKLSVAALAKTPKQRAFMKNPGTAADCRKNPCWKKADLHDPSDNLLEGVGKAIEGHEARVKLGKGEGRVAEKGMEEAMDYGVWKLVNWGITRF